MTPLKDRQDVRVLHLSVISSCLAGIRYEAAGQPVGVIAIFFMIRERIKNRRIR